MGKRMPALLAIWLLVPVGLVGQAADTSSCGGESPVGSLGITGISCDRCQFYTDHGRPRAVFWTEPTITRLDAGEPAASVLEEGDVLVAVDGHLITTREGSARYSSLPAGGEVTLRIRRDGRVRDVRAPLAAVCPSSTIPAIAGSPLPPSAPAPPAAVTGSAANPTPPLPPSPGTAPLPPASRAVGVSPAPQVVPTPAAPSPPLPPAPDAILPRAELGFAFTCSYCSYESRDGGRWTFSEPPVVSGVGSVTSGGAAGLRPGDRILQVNGQDITKESGARAFGQIRPGDHPRWTVERDGRQETIVTTARRQTRLDAREEATVSANPSHAPLRYTGTVGNTLVEVRGGRVNVMETEGDSLVIIRTRDAEIRIRVPRGGKEPPGSSPPSGDGSR